MFFGAPGRLPKVTERVRALGGGGDCVEVVLQEQLLGDTHRGLGFVFVGTLGEGE